MFDRSLFQNSPSIKAVGSFQELLGTPFGNGVNALYWPRELKGNFQEVVEQLGCGDGITALDDKCLASLTLSPEGRAAANFMLADLRLLQTHGLAPELNCILGYPREEEPGVVPTNVYSYHVDSAMEEADTWLCTYYGPPSEGISNHLAKRKVDLPETRAVLLREYGGADDSHFIDYLEDHCYHLHYAPEALAQPYSFGVGPLWRIAVDYPGSPVLPSIHRAPEILPGQLGRLLLIS